MKSNLIYVDIKENKLEKKFAIFLIKIQNVDDNDGCTWAGIHGPLG